MEDERRELEFKEGGGGRDYLGRVKRAGEDPCLRECGIREKRESLRKKNKRPKSIITEKIDLIHPSHFLASTPHLSYFLIPLTQ